MAFHLPFSVSLSAALVVTLICCGKLKLMKGEEPFSFGRKGIELSERKCTADRNAPKIAIIIDDIGKYENEFEPFVALGIPITFSILPGQPYSGKHSEMIRALGFEQMLHIPLEPEEREKIDDINILMTTMEDSEITARLEAFFEKFPYIKGVNQHMGSKFSQDRGKMRLLLEEVKKRGLYFIDSRTTDKTIAIELAQEMGIVSASRDVFLDNSRDVNEILLSLDILRKKALKSGAAIGIGHPFSGTFSALSSFLSEACGSVVFVPVSEVLTPYRVPKGQ